MARNRRLDFDEVEKLLSEKLGTKPRASEVQGVLNICRNRLNPRFFVDILFHERIRNWRSIIFAPGFNPDAWADQCGKWADFADDIYPMPEEIEKIVGNLLRDME